MLVVNQRKHCYTRAGMVMLGYYLLSYPHLLHLNLPGCKHSTPESKRDSEISLNHPFENSCAHLSESHCEV